MTQAVYAGTFDPVTFGHLDVAARAAQVFEHLVLAVAEDPRKALLFSTAERLELARESLSHLKNVEVVPFDGPTFFLMSSSIPCTLMLAPPWSGPLSEPMPAAMAE